MDETDAHKRKRESSGSFINKKQALQNQEIEEEASFDIEIRVKVLLEQKRALLNAFEQQKIELSDLTYNLSNTQNKKELYETVLEKSLSLWNQLELELESTVIKLGQELPPGQTDRGTLSLYNSDLSGELLERKRDRLSGLLQTVHSITDNYHKKRHNALTALTQDPVKTSILGEECETLKKENSRLVSHVEEYSHQYKSLTTKYSDINISYNRIKDRVEEYESQISELKNTLQTTSKKLNKLEIEASEEAKYLKRKSLEEANERDNTSNNNINNNISNNNNSTNNIKSPKHEGNNSMDNNNEDIQSLNHEISDLKSSLQNKNNQLSQLQEEKLELIKETLKLKEAASSKTISEEVVLSSDIYKRIYEKYQTISYEWDSLRQHHEKLKHDYYLQRDNFRKDREKSENEEKNRRDKLESALRDEQLQVVKCKGEIDSLLNKLDIKNSSNPSKLLDELKLIISTRESEIKKLKDQNEKYKEDSMKLKTFQEDQKKNTDKLYDQIDLKTNEVKDLQYKIRELKVTIEDYVNQKKQWEDKNREYKLLLETYQSQAKDKRELKEIRLSEKKLQDELAIIQDKLDQYERSPLVIQIKELEDKHIEEIESLKKEHSIKLFNAEKSIKQLKSSLESQKQEYESIVNELEAISKIYEDLQDQNTRLIDQLSEREDTLTRITSDQIRSSQVHTLLNEEKQALLEKLTKSEEKYTKQQDYLIKTEQRAKLLQDQVKKQTDELKLNLALIENLKVQYKDASAECAHIKIELTRIQKEKQDELKRANDLTIQLEKESHKSMKLEEEAQSAKRKLDRLKSSGGVTDELVLEELNLLKHKTTCGVCNDKPKDTVIARCFHTFCNHCVRKNLEVRSRKCPACGKSFDQSDVHSIYL